MSEPLGEHGEPGPGDERLVELGLSGSRDAIDQLLRRHQGWIYNVALRILQSPPDAEDATQESLLKIVTRLSSFRGESSFRTWAHRIAVHHVLDVKRSAPERAVNGFGCFATYLANTPDEDVIPDQAATPADTLVLIEEAKLACMMGMLLCFDREQRLVFVLGEILEVTDAVGAELVGVSRDGFRQKLHRAREQINGFMRGCCGLMDPGNPCRCARKTRAFIRDGIVDPARLVFARPHVSRAQLAAARDSAAFEAAIESANATLYRDQPMIEPPDLVARLRGALEGDAFRHLLEHRTVF